MLVLPFIWCLPFAECKTKNQNFSLAKMKLLAVSNVIVTFCLLTVVDCGSVSLLSSRLNAQGIMQVYFDKPREIIWSGLTNGKSYVGVRTCDFSCFFCSLVLEFGHCSTVSWLFLLSLIYVVCEFNTGFRSFPLTQAYCPLSTYTNLS